MNTEHWALIGTMAVLTYATRLSGLSMGDRSLPQSARTLLDRVPIAVFAALTAPGIFGSNVDVSLKDLPSGMDCWTWVGELVLGVEPPGNSFFERVLVRLPDFSGWAITGGDVRA